MNIKYFHKNINKKKLIILAVLTTLSVFFTSCNEKENDTYNKSNDSLMDFMNDNSSKYIELADGKIDREYLEKAIYPRLLMQGLSIENVKLSDDYDDDGLTLIQEYEYDTNPFSKDTDEDGLEDFDELDQYKTNPIDNDTDDDGVSDGTEVYGKLNPLKEDSDGDGITDDKESVKQVVRLESLYEYELEEVGTLMRLELSGKGDYSNEMYYQTIQHNGAILDIPCLVGTAFEIVYDEPIEFESGKVSFEISNDILEAYDIEDLAIALYTEDNILQPLYTVCDGNDNILTADIEELGTYMVISISRLFY